jgi:predicted ATP-grasp superfamily ATP-dependent carboligase
MIVNQIFQLESMQTDFRAAANVVDAISKIVPEAYCEIQLLTKEAENIENNLKMINSQASNKFEKQMYR